MRSGEYADLRAKAQAAQSDEWWDQGAVAFALGNAVDAEYIAAVSPSVLLGLLDELEAAREALDDEQFWRNGGAFHWCWPKLDIFRPADTRVRSGFNRYPHNIIGAYVVLFGRGWGVRWKAK